MLTFHPPVVTETGTDWSDTIFKYFKVPEGLDVDKAINYIRKRCYSFEVVFPDYIVMQNAIKVLCDIYSDKWEYFLKTTNAEYDPLIDFTESWNENKNVKDKFTRTRTGSTNREQKTTGTNSSRAENHANDNDTSKLNKAAYNSGTLQPAESTQRIATTVGGSDETAESSINSNSKDNMTSENVHDGSQNTDRDIKISGATGRLTAPEMIELQRNIYLNMYLQIADDFAHELCIMVY